MIARYARPQMTAIWAPENRLRLWLEVELSALEAMAGQGRVPAAAAAAVRAAAERRIEAIIDPARIEAIEATTRHDVIAFLTHLEQVIGPEARYLHLGMTRSDLVDTAWAASSPTPPTCCWPTRPAARGVRRQAFEHWDTLCVGRTHGMHAEPTTFGHKLAGFDVAFDRNRRRLETARAEVAVGTISGAVGTFANVDPFVEPRTRRGSASTPEPASSQVVPRDRHAAFLRRSRSAPAASSG